MDKKVLLENVNESIDNGPIGFCNCYADVIYVNSSNISTCSCIFTFWYSNMDPISYLWIMTKFYPVCEIGGPQAHRTCGSEPCLTIT